MQEQVAKLAGQPDIVISTPGRLVPHIQEGRLWLMATSLTVD